MKSNTSIVREEIAAYLKKCGEGVKVRQADLTKAIRNSSNVATGGIIRGIYNRTQGIGGSPKPIPNVSFSKDEDGKVFYYYDSTSNTDFSEDSVILKIKQKTIEFEESLNEENLLNVSLLELSVDERKIYLKFIDQFEELKNIFTTK